MATVTVGSRTSYCVPSGRTDTNHVVRSGGFCTAIRAVTVFRAGREVI